MLLGSSRLFGVALAGVLAWMPADAHHSIAAVYDSSRQVTVEGVVTMVRFVSPHPSITIEVTDRGGPIEEWLLELDNRWELVAIGITAETLRPGDHLVVTGSLSRNHPRSLYVLALARPSDGFQYEQVGGTPRIR